MVLQLELEVQNPKPPSWYSEQAVLAADVLSLLDDPDGTSDLTVIVGGGNGSAAAGGNASSGSGGAGGIGEAAAPGGSSLPRSFRVHRAVLAARCPYFRTLFDVGMADSAARELRLPDADPDAFAALLRCMYGGEVLQCERAVHCAAIQLCDMLLLPTIKDALREVLVECADASTIIGDLLWAAQAGQEEILEELLGVYKRVGVQIATVGSGLGPSSWAKRACLTQSPLLGRPWPLQMRLAPGRLQVPVAAPRMCVQPYSQEGTACCMSACLPSPTSVFADLHTSQPPSQPQTGEDVNPEQSSQPYSKARIYAEQNYVSVFAWMKSERYQLIAAHPLHLW